MDMRREIDEVTLRRAQRTDASACHALVMMYQRRVIGLCLRIGGTNDRASAEDAAQETFVAVFQQLKKFNMVGPARLSTWILAIAARRAIDGRRKSEAASRLQNEVAILPAASTMTSANSLDRSDWIAAALAELSAEHRAVLLLSDVYEFDQREIAKALEIEVGTVKSRLSRARAALRYYQKNNERVATLARPA
jgi:RNA polymerase sigma-70 factor, ECF subfamily